MERCEFVTSCRISINIKKRTMDREFARLEATNEEPVAERKSADITPQDVNEFYNDIYYS